MSTNKAAAAPRTLAEDLRSRPDDALAELLRLRPDLLGPVPGDITRLATRAATRGSVARTVERLDLFTLRVLQAVLLVPDGAAPSAVAALFPDAPSPVVDEALGRLRVLGLLWGEPAHVHLVRAARELLEPGLGDPASAGLGPSFGELAALRPPSRLRDLVADLGLPPTPDAVHAIVAITELFADAARLGALLEAAPARAREVLDELTWGPPFGTINREAAAARVATARTPVEWLLARGLLLPTDRAAGSTVRLALPREVALHLRGHRAHRDTAYAPPAPSTRGHDPETVDRVAAGAAFTAVRAIEELLDRWDAGGPPVLRAGGLGVRELRRLAADWDRTPEEAAFFVELAYAAGLLAGDGEADELWAPTPAADEWRRRDAAERWLALAEPWLATSRVPGLVGRKNQAGRSLNALDPELDRPLAVEVRRGTLAELAALTPGSAPAPDDLVERLRWRHPLRGAGLRDDLTRWALAEAERLGIVALGALSAPGRALLDSADAAAALAPLLPEPLDAVVLQADLTAVAPGPLRTELAHTLAVAAEIESTGGATVYRFTPASVRRAMDAGRTAEELRDFLAAHSSTPLPQPLDYLIADVARRHGRLRVGAVSSYLRCDDETLLTELQAERRAAGLGLRRLAPTVLAAQSSAETVLERLRQLGYAPAAESAAGEVLIRRPDARRGPPRALPVPVGDGPPLPEPALLTAAIRAIRAGDEAASSAPTAVTIGPAAGEPPRAAAGETLQALRRAVTDGGRWWLGYVDSEGSASQHVVEPVRVAGGMLTAFDHTTAGVRSFAVHRITGVAALDAGELSPRPPVGS